MSSKDMQINRLVLIFSDIFMGIYKNSQGK